MNRIENILKSDIINLSEKDFRKNLTILISAANKRIKRGEKTEKDIVSPYLQKYLGTRFSLKNKSYTDTLNEYREVKQFLENKTSSISGYKKLLKESVKKLKEKGIKTDIKHIKQLWSIYNKLEERDPWISEQGKVNYDLQKDINESIKDGLNMDEIMEKLTKKIDLLYEGVQDDTDFFELY